MRPSAKPDTPAASADSSGSRSPAAPPRSEADESPHLRASGRIRRISGQLRVRITSARSAVELAIQTQRPQSRVLDASIEIYELDADVGGGILAGAVAFRMFLFMVPYAYVACTLLGATARMANENPAHLAKTVGITGLLASAVVNTQDLSTWTQVLLTLGAAMLLIITARTLAKALYAVHWLVWRVPRMKPKGIVPLFAVIGVTLAMSVLILGLDDLRNRQGWLGAVLTVLVVAAGAFALWLWVSMKLPHGDAPLSALIPGALVIAIGAEFLQLLTIYWIANLVARRSQTYGTIGVALAVLFWVYVLGRLIVGSADLNATLWRRHLKHAGSAG
jgi:uncharacterized BrkB/YihY/UPF0761 family membrane protein